MVYSPPIIRIICDLIVAGHSLRAICAIHGLPGKATVMRWLKDPRKIAFLDAYRRAKSVQAIMIADQLRYMVECGAHFSSLGQWGGRPHKMWLKTNDAPTGRGWLSQLQVELERRARLQYGTPTTQL